MISYDKVPENEDILLDLPFREGVGTVTMDHAKPHHPMLMIDPGAGSFVWTTLASGLMVLEFSVAAGPAGVYLECDSTDTADLDFTSGDYSLGCWVKWAVAPEYSQIVMGRYELDVSGWELYFTNAASVDYLTLRHHHAGTLVGGNPRSACYSVGWTQSVWCFLGVSRTGGGEALQYRNGAAVDMVTGGLVDPETETRDLTIGCRYSKNSNFLSGFMGRPRIWGRALAAAEWAEIFKTERTWFGI